MNKRTKHGSANESQDKRFKHERKQTKKKQMNHKFQPKKYTKARNRPTNIFQEKDKINQRKKSSKRTRIEPERPSANPRCKKMDRV